MHATEPRLQTVGEYVEAFEAARARDGFADIPVFLPHPADPLHLGVLRELVRIELEWSWERGKPRRLEDYRISFPELFTDRESLLLITFEEFRLRVQAGEQPEPAEYERRFGVATAAWPPLSGRPATPPSSGVRILHNVGEGVPPAKLTALYGAEPGTAPCSPQTVDRLPRPGEQFLEFRLHAELGRGAFGRVFLARQGDLADRWVALKVAPDLGDESHTLAQLQHTHIVPIYSVHRAGSLQAVCMPYFGATTLAHVLEDVRASAELPGSGRGLLHTLDARRSVTRLTAQSLEPDCGPASASKDSVAPTPGSLTPAQSATSHFEGLTYVEAILWLGERLADGLAHAHARGILHRDLKPANVLLADDGRPMLLDFNLAEDIKQTGSAARASVGGTLPYMAPEHLEAFRDGIPRVDARSDVFALGVILYELLTGRHPFPERRGPLNSLLPEMIADRAGPPPALRHTNKAVTPAVEAIVRRCLEPDPARRYQGAGELRDDLLRQLENRPLRHTREPSWRERFAKWRRRHPRLTSTTLVGSVALVLLGALAGLFWTLHRRQAVVGALDTLDRLRDQGKQMRFFLMAPDVEGRDQEEGRTLARHVFSRYGVLSESAWLTRSPVSDLAEADRAQLRTAVGELLLLDARVALRQAETAHPSRREELREEARQRHAAAVTCYTEDDAPRALWLLAADLADTEEEAQALRARAARQSLREFTDHYLLVADHLARGRYRDAMPLLEQIGAAKPLDYDARLALGYCHTILRQTDRAEAQYRQAIRLKPDAYEAYFNRGILYLGRKYYEPACADFDEVLRLRPDHGPALYNRAVARFGLGQHEGALADLDALLRNANPPLRGYLLRARIREARGAPALAWQDRQEAFRRPPTSAADWSARGEARAPREPEAALADLDCALALNPGFAEAWQSRAHVLAEQLHRCEDAVAALDRVLALEPESVPARAGRGVLLARLGRRDAALADARAVLIRDRLPPTLYQIGCVYALTSRQEQTDGAEALRLISAALRQGYGAELLERDLDLKALHGLPEYRRLVQLAKELRGAGAKPR